MTGCNDEWLLVSTFCLCHQKLCTFCLLVLSSWAFFVFSHLKQLALFFVCFYFCFFVVKWISRQRRFDGQYLDDEQRWLQFDLMSLYFTYTSLFTVFCTSFVSELSGLIAAPTFISVPRSRSVAVGRRVSFECQATGSPAPVVTWKKDQRPVLCLDFISSFFSFVQHNTVSRAHFTIRLNGTRVSRFERF